MFKPVFPYKGNQLILTSDRVTIHSKTDAIFLFGKEAVSLSSVKTINLDSKEKILLDSKIIELGPKAQTLGEPIILGETFTTQLILLLNNLSNAGILLSQASETNLAASMQLIASAGQTINKETNRLIQVLNKKVILSKTTFTR
jgi:hypothetical protein